MLFALLAALGGVIVSLINYLISRAAMKAKPALLPATSIFRQLISIGYITLVYFAATRLELEPLAPLIGAALGATLPMFYFTYRLVRDKKPDDSNKGE